MSTQNEINNTNKQNNTQTIIADVQKNLGVPEERHFTKKEPLLKITIGSVTSNLALAEKYDEATKSYLPPVPTYSLYFMEKVRDENGSMKNNVTSIPIPKDADSIRAFGEHLLKVAEAIEGLELGPSSQAVDDLDVALSKLKAFKSGGKA